MKLQIVFYRRDSKIRVLELALPKNAVVEICTQDEIAVEKPEVNNVAPGRN